MPCEPSDVEDGERPTRDIGKTVWSYQTEQR